MKVLILNGSPRPDGDTAYILNMLKKRFPCNTAFETLNTFEADISPCSDCRYCWEHEGCCVRDRMDLLWKDDYDVLVLASPLYMSFVTPPLFSVISRLNAVWANRFFLKKPDTMRSKKGILVLTGGGDGSPAPAVGIAKTAFRFLNASFNPDTDYIYSLNTNSVPVREDPEIISRVENAVKHIIGSEKT